MAQGVVITGCGVLAANGIGREAFAAALAQGKSGIGDLVSFDASALGRERAAEIHGFDVAGFLRSPKNYLDRNSALAFAAAEMSLRESGLAVPEIAKGYGLSVGSMGGNVASLALFHAKLVEKGPRFAPPFLFPHTYYNTTAGLLSIEYGLSGPHGQFCSGPAAGMEALEYAVDCIRWGRTDAMLAGGVEAFGEQLFRYCAANGWLSPNSPLPERGQCGTAAPGCAGTAGKLPAGARQCGTAAPGCAESPIHLSTGEGACATHGPDRGPNPGRCGTAALGCADQAGKLRTAEGGCPAERCHPFAVAGNGFILGEGAAFLCLESADGARVRKATVRGRIRGIGRGACPEEAMAAALRDAEILKADAVFAAASGLPDDDRQEAAAIAKLMPDKPVVALKSLIGETLGAAGPLNLIAALSALESDILPGAGEGYDAFPVNLVRTPLSHPLRIVMVNAGSGQPGRWSSLVVTR